jgi:hypothetical protein
MRRVQSFVLFTTAWLGLVLAGPAAAAPYYGHSYALVVGIDAYAGGRWHPLAYARRDAEAVAHLLQRQGFEVTALYDAQATKTAIVSALQTRLAPRLAPDDRVLVFFAGHGYTEHLGEQDFGYLVPYDGTDDSATYLSMEELRALSEKMGRAKHQLFILNACYGGLFGLRGQVLRVDPHIPGYLDQVTHRAAREFITAGGRDQQVQDGGPGGLSFFTYYLIEALGKGLGDLDGDGAITFPELAGYLVPRATNAYQTPVAGELPGHGGGEFVFFTKKAAATPEQPTGTSSVSETHIAGRPGHSAAASGVMPTADTSSLTQIGRWLSQHLWQIFSGIGTAAVAGLLGWLVRRLRRGSSKPPPSISQVAIGEGIAQAAGNGVSQKVEHHAGNRSVHIAGNATDNVIVTGNSNTVSGPNTGRKR